MRSFRSGVARRMRVMSNLIGVEKLKFCSPSRDLSASALVRQLEQSSGSLAMSEGAKYSAIEVLRDRRRVEIRALRTWRPGGPPRSRRPHQQAVVIPPVLRRKKRFHGAGNRILLERRLH